MRYAQITITALCFGLLLSCFGAAKADTTRTCADWAKHDPDAAGVNLISICQSELEVGATKWRATTDPITMGHLQIGMGRDYWAIAYYCEYYGKLEHHKVDDRCAPGTDHDLVPSSIAAAKSAYVNAKRDSKNAPEVVKTADDLLASQFEVPSASHRGWLPTPAKLCALWSRAINGGSVPKWQLQPSKEYGCPNQDFISPIEGAVYMAYFHAAGPTKNRVSRFYFKFDFVGSTLPKDQIAEPILSRLSAVFAAANVGTPPADVVGAVRDLTTTTSYTRLGEVRTRFTPGTDPANPNSGAMYEVQVDVP
jgi:hypothetical protein